MYHNNHFGLLIKNKTERSEKLKLTFTVKFSELTNLRIEGKTANERVFKVVTVPGSEAFCMLCPIDTDPQAAVTCLYSIRVD